LRGLGEAVLERGAGMIVGDPSVFAIESGITEAYERLSFRALGFFVIHVGGRRYGVYEPDATMLACAFGEAERRTADRGLHTAAFAGEQSADKIAYAFRNAIYADVQENAHFGIPLNDFCELVHSHHLADWTPHGDEAFDDGSYVLQFDVDDRVRLIAYKSQGFSYDPVTLSDVWLEAETFYGVLSRWHDAFEAEWAATAKIPQAEDGAEG
jgi:hypothetical protein